MMIRSISKRSHRPLEAELAKLAFKPEVILASFHGLPEDYFRKGDPYPSHCAETTRLLRERLGLDEDQLMMTFQSRFGRAEWLKPYTDETVKVLAQRGIKNLAVVTPGFSADCLETLEEIAVENGAHLHRQWRRELRSDSLSQRQRRRHERDQGAGDTRTQRLDCRR